MGLEPQASAPPNLQRAQADPWIVRVTLILLAAGILGVLVVLPVINVFYQALAQGPHVYWESLMGDADTRHAILLTLTVAPAAVAANLVFGVSAAWCIA